MRVANRKEVQSYLEVSKIIMISYQYACDCILSMKKNHVHLFLSLSLSPRELKTPKSILVPKTCSILSSQLGSLISRKIIF